MSAVVIAGDVSGTVTLDAPAAAGSTVLTLPSASGTVASTGFPVTFTAPQRGAIVTDNDLSFDLTASNNFTCTPTGTGTLTFTNQVAGQSGYVLLINTGGHAISAAATTKVSAAFLATVSSAGTYLISYYSNGTNAFLTASGALS